MLFINYRTQRHNKERKYDKKFIYLTIPISIGYGIYIAVKLSGYSPYHITPTYSYMFHLIITAYWLIVKVVRLYEDLRRSRKSVSYFLEKTKENNHEMIKALAATLEMRDKYTAGHSERVRDFAYVLAWELKLDKDEKEILSTGCLLHDIGKIGVPEYILNKSGTLNYDEYETIKRHPAIGMEMLRYLEDFHPFLDIIRHHHERIDGKGYPNGLAGDTIPKLARIVAIADTFDALTSDRIYREGVSFEKGVQILLNLRDTQLDAHFVNLFVRRMKDIYELKITV